MKKRSYVHVMPLHQIQEMVAPYKKWENLKNIDEVDAEIFEMAKQEFLRWKKEQKIMASWRENQQAENK
jgi:hypothetical protein